MHACIGIISTVTLTVTVDKFRIMLYTLYRTLRNKVTLLLVYYACWLYYNNIL